MANDNLKRVTGVNFLGNLIDEHGKIIYHLFLVKQQNK